MLPQLRPEEAKLSRIWSAQDAQLALRWRAAAHPGTQVSPANLKKDKWGRLKEFNNTVPNFQLLTHFSWSGLQVEIYNKGKYEEKDGIHRECILKQKAFRKERQDWISHITLRPYLITHKHKSGRDHGTNYVSNTRACWPHSHYGSSRRMSKPVSHNADLWTQFEKQRRKRKKAHSSKGVPQSANPLTETSHWRSKGKHRGFLSRSESIPSHSRKGTPADDLPLEVSEQLW